MDDKITIDLDHDTMDALSRRAREHGRSVDEEAADIVRQNVPVRKTMERDPVEWARSIRAMTPKGAPQTDSQTLLREDRRSEEEGEPVDWVARARQVRAMSPKGAVQTDSVRIIREDRERGHSIDRR